MPLNHLRKERMRGGLWKEAVRAEKERGEAAYDMFLEFVVVERPSARGEGKKWTSCTAERDGVPTQLRGWRCKAVHDGMQSCVWASGC